MRNVSDEMKNVSVECHVGKQKKVSSQAFRLLKQQLDRCFIDTANL